MYRTEKDILSQTGDTIVLSPDFINVINKDFCTDYIMFFQIIHSPYLDSFSKVVIDKDYKLPDLEENEKIVFTNLLKDKKINKPAVNYIENNIEIINN